ncbi:RpnC/YadD family protein [Pedobacter psychroterrae]|uniref:Transposase/invertase (TIGR01784 family) n=1 Tax=Pedobacter psychroterrae TaxID=2530453 RepID=A0A4V2ML99_9SPHI|nr:hypothetical protein [Pedobacter psychroterrae]TCD01267.1 hypothetical protein EZ437_10960 [Pedobacter psychroterrae]
MQKEIDIPIFNKRQKRSSKPRKKSDELLKGAFEDHFFDFLRFVYPDAEDIIDFSKGVEFMDKELFAIVPNRESKGDKREADLLAKLYLKDGTEKWVILNVEIEGGNDVDFAFRLLQYNYRIRDRYKTSAATIVVFTGDKNQKQPTEYKDVLLGTILSFKYTTYHVFDHSQAFLLETPNPFALIVLACQKALLEGKIPEEELSQERLTIVKALLIQKYDRDKIMRFMGFIKNFIFIKNKDINAKFDQQVRALTGGTIDMGIIETLKMQERREGEAKGRQSERTKAKEEKRQIAHNLKNKGIDMQIIAEATSLSFKEIEAL